MDGLIPSKYHVYTLFSTTHNKVYIGYIYDVKRDYTSTTFPHSKDILSNTDGILVHPEIYATKKEAIYRGKQLKSASGK